ncbi:MAG: hypothetical protein HGB20_03875 [Chlorobiaceae bacterium]|nr:hypothetical protein [Chlorobiaceae bacterium]
MENMVFNLNLLDKHSILTLIDNNKRNPIFSAELKRLTALCKKRNVTKSYVITKNIEDFGVLPLTGDKRIRALKIPASLACYWLGESETLPE